MQGISEELSPCEIVLRWQLSANIHTRAKLGSYCVVYNDAGINNTQDLHGRDSICLTPTGNMQGTFKFLDLETERVIKRKQFEEYSMPDLIKRRVEAIGIKQE